MTLNKKNYISIFFVLITVGVIFYFFNNNKCYGEECTNIEIEEIRYETYGEMDPSKIVQQINNNEIFLLDVREKIEWDEGYIKGANHIPLADINEKTAELLPKDKPVFIYCRSGRRAEEAKNILNNLGFDNVKNIGGVNHWIERGGSLMR